MNNKIFYINLLKNYISKHNKRNAQKITLRIQSDEVAIVSLNETLAWASNLEDLCIMLFLTRDTRQDIDPYYWIDNKEIWGYNPKFLKELLKKEGKRNV